MAERRINEKKENRFKNQTYYLIDEKEKVQYDSAGFPVYLVIGDLLMFPGMKANCHWHEDLEFIYMLDGHMTYSIDGTLELLEPGDGIFINSKHMHFGYSDDGTNCHYICFLLTPMLLHLNEYISQSFVAPVTSNLSMPYIHLTRDVAWQNELLQILPRLYSIYQKQDPGYELELESAFFQLLLLLYRNMPLAKGKPGLDKERADLNRLKGMLSYMEKHLTEPFTLEELAASQNISISTCCRYFTKYLRRRPFEYLIELRLEMSCRLLCKTEYSITDIATRCGFSASSYYAKCFRTFYKTTPGEYRRQHAETADTQNSAT